MNARIRGKGAQITNYESMLPITPIYTKQAWQEYDPLVSGSLEFVTAAKLLSYA